MSGATAYAVQIARPECLQAIEREAREPRERPDLQGVHPPDTKKGDFGVMHRECTCPNCCRTFHAASISAVAEYCPECWEAWISAAGRFEKRTDRYKKQGD